MTHGAITTDRSAADAHGIAISYTLNGEAVSCEVDARTLLVHHLREERNLTGTHIGCDTSQCGACAVHVDGRAVKSCTVLAVQVDGCEVTTDRRGARASPGRSAPRPRGTATQARTNATGMTYDSGDYEKALDKALDMIGWDGLLADMT